MAFIKSKEHKIYEHEMLNPKNTFFFEDCTHLHRILTVLGFERVEKLLSIIYYAKTETHHLFFCFRYEPQNELGLTQRIYSCEKFIQDIPLANDCINLKYSNTGALIERNFIPDFYPANYNLQSDNLDLADFEDNKKIEIETSQSKIPVKFSDLIEKYRKAIEENDIQMVKEIFCHGMNPNWSKGRDRLLHENDQTFFPFKEALRKCEYLMVKLFIDSGYQVKKSDISFIGLPDGKQEDYCNIKVLLKEKIEEEELKKKKKRPRFERIPTRGR